MDEEKFDLYLEENEDGYFLNGIQISETTYRELMNVMDANQSYSPTQCDDECEICEITEDIIIMSKNPDYNTAFNNVHNYLEALFDEEYNYGIRDGFQNVIELSQAVITEMNKNLDGAEDN